MHCYQKVVHLGGTLGTLRLGTLVHVVGTCVQCESAMLELILSNTMI